MAATIVGALLAAPLLSAPAVAQLPGDDDVNPWLERRVLNIGHRGSGFEAPENTLFGLQTAVDNGAHMLEFDLFGSADGEVVAIHDDTVDRTTDGTGAVEDLTLEELKQLDAAFWFVGGSYVDRDADEDDYLFRGVATGDRAAPAGTTPNDFTIPTLREIFERFPRMPMILEIKELRALPDQTVETEICRLLEEFERGDEVILAGFDDADIERVARCAPAEVSTSPGTAEAASFFATSRTGQPLPGTFLRHDVLFLPLVFNGIRVVDENTVAAAQGNDLALHVFTVNDPADQRELLDLGVDGIVNDVVSQLDDLLDAAGVGFDPLPACPAGAPAAPFSDRDATPRVHRQALDCGADRGVVRGMRDGTFGPQRDIRRDQLASIIVRALQDTDRAPDLPEADDADDRFVDLDGNVHADAVRQLFAAGILQGRSDTRFDPGSATRRDQIASIVLRATAFASGRDLAELTSTTRRFDDVGPSNVHFEAVNGAAELGLLRGRTDGLFAPTTSLRRDQMVTVVVRQIGEVERGSLQPPR